MEEGDVAGLVHFGDRSPSLVNGLEMFSDAARRCIRPAVSDAANRPFLPAKSHRVASAERWWRRGRRPRWRGAVLVALIHERLFSVNPGHASRSNAARRHLCPTFARMAAPLPSSDFRLAGRGE